MDVREGAGDYLPKVTGVQYEKKVQEYLKNHLDHIVIRRLRTNQPLTATDLRGLEQTLVDRRGRRPDAVDEPPGPERRPFWAIFDRDEHPNYNEALELCRNNGIGIGRSDPCFELWLILDEREYDRPDGRHAVQALLKALRPEYEIDGAKTPDCDDLITRVEDAERRGEAQLQRREEEDRPFGNPSTTVGQLTGAISEAAKHAP